MGTGVSQSKIQNYLLFEIVLKKASVGVLNKTQVFHSVIPVNWNDDRKCLDLINWHIPSNVSPFCTFLIPIYSWFEKYIKKEDIKNWKIFWRRRPLVLSVLLSQLVSYTLTFLWRALSSETYILFDSSWRKCSVKLRVQFLIYLGFPWLIKLMINSRILRIHLYTIHNESIFIIN